MSPEPPAMPPAEFATLVKQADDGQLEEGLAANRELILDQIFAAMPGRLRGERAAQLDAVVEWEITGPPEGSCDRFQVLIRRGACTVRRGGSDAPSVHYRIGAVDFLRLVGGNASGPELFLFGRLQVRGDLILAARMPSMFDMPTSE